MELIIAICLILAFCILIGQGKSVGGAILIILLGLAAPYILIPALIIWIFCTAKGY